VNLLEMVTVSTRASPTMRRRRLGGQLRRLREASGLRIEQVAGALKCSTSKISRIETGQVMVGRRDLRNILALYRISDARHEELIKLAREAQEKSWWHADSELANVATLMDFEAEATSIRTFGGLLLPGLLQTAGYARAVISALRPGLPPEEVERWVHLRLTRQSLLDDENAPFYCAILDDAALRRDVGGREVMSEQLQHLAEVASLPNVTLQVLPYIKGAHAGMCGDFTIFRFSEPDDQDIVYLEHNAGDLYLEHREQVDRHERVFDDLCAEALAPDESVSILATITRLREINITMP
jgi:transcriptional regulator with XRE-family HTH domain